MLGGIGLIVCGVLGMLQSSAHFIPGAQWLSIAGDVVYAASVLLFAVGLTREASVVARKPLGVTAMVVVAVWPLVNVVIVQAISAGITQEIQDFTVVTTYSYVALIVSVGSALVAAVQIARAGTVPSPWRWAPLWVLGAQAVMWAIPQAMLATAGTVDVQSTAGLLNLLGTLSSLAGTLGLGILALVLASRPRPESVEVFRSA